MWQKLCQNFCANAYMQLVLLLTVFSAFSLAQTPASISVDGGSLKGTLEDGLTVYRGIPFAAPPVGDLRWHAPQAAAK